LVVGVRNAPTGLVANTGSSFVINSGAAPGPALFPFATEPRNFGRFSGDLLIGNFGNGRINAYQQRSRRIFTHVGLLRARSGKTLVIDRLWALQFGHGTAGNEPINRHDNRALNPAPGRNRPLRAS
jgi:hypothetical protein